MIFDRVARAIVDRGELRTVSAQDIYTAIGSRRRGKGGTRAIDADKALTHSAVWGCVRSISDPISIADRATFPSAGREGLVRSPARAVDSPPIFSDPDPDAYPGDARGWLESIVMSAALTGNAFGLVTSREPSRPLQARSMTLVHPSDVSLNQPRRYARPTWKVDGVPVDLWPNGPLWIWSVFRPPGSPLGLSPVGNAARSIRLGIQAEDFGLDWFDNNNHPSGLLSTDYKFRPTPEDDAVAERLKDRFKDAAFGQDVAVLGHGVAYQPLHIPAEDSQFLETIGANVATVCRFYRVQPEMVAGQAGNSMTYANIQQRWLDHLGDAVSPWSIRLEDALARLTPGLRPWLRLDAHDRLDSAEKSKKWDSAIRHGRMSVNETRAEDNRDGIGPEGDRFLWPPALNASISLTGEDVDVTAEDTGMAP